MAKGKPQPLKRQFAAGGVVFRQNPETLWLVTKAKETPDAYGVWRKSEVWRLPKGWLDDEAGHARPGPLTRGDKRATEEDLKKAARREVEEEGGVKTRILGKVDTARYFVTIWGEKFLKFSTFYLMEWQHDLPEGPGWETEKVEWLPVEEAVKRLTFAHEKEVLKKAKELLERGTQEALI